MRVSNRMQCLDFLCPVPRSILLFAAAVFLNFSASAQISQAWVARYNNGITNGTNQAVKMALDSNGNIIITGFSQNTNNQLGYVTIKYTPNGTQLWATRFDSTNYPTATPAGLALDSSNNVVVTGSAVTVKYDTNGNQLWTAPYDGNGVAVDADGNSIVTGYASGFNTVKLSPNGSNLWSQSYVSTYGPALAQAIVIDASGNVYVAGWDTWGCDYEGNFEECFEGLLTAKYDTNGNQIWINVPEGGDALRVFNMAIDAKSNFYIIGNDFNQPWLSFAYSANGSALWGSGPIYNMVSFGGMVIDTSSRMIIVGAAVPSENSYPYTSIMTVSLNTNGTPLWTNYFPISPATYSGGDSISPDQNNGIYVSGYSAGSNGTNNIVTIRYTSGGSQLGVQQYNGLDSGNDAGNAIVVDKSGNVYVTGYETLPAAPHVHPGTGIVTVKYVPISIQPQTNGTVMIQASGSPGEMFDIEASTNLQTWFDLGTVIADTNGLMQFDDTNAVEFPFRFYYTKPK